jgi:hypothetical protein
MYMKNKTPMTKRTVALLAAAAVVVAGALIQDKVTQRDREAALDAYQTQQAMAQLDQTLAAHEAQLEADRQAKAAAEAAKQTPQADPLGDWAVRAYEAENAHQNKCWDQLDSRGYGDPGCY